MAAVPESPVDLKLDGFVVRAWREATRSQRERAALDMLSNSPER
jgi:hypothetical protein